MSPRMFWFAGACALVVGCVEAVPLGSECPRVRLEDCQDAARDVVHDDEPPPDTGRARPETGVDGPPAPPRPSSSPARDASLDAMLEELDDASVGARAENDAGGEDGGDVGEDDATVEPDLLYPGLENGSFAITDGLPGPLVYEPVDPLPLGANLATPWTACRLGFNLIEQADAERGSLAGDVLPPDPPTFVESEIGLAAAVMGLSQTLPVPLTRGERYAFRIDVRAALGADVALEVWGAFGCIQAVQLARVEAISDQDWESRCIVFTAPLELPELVLAPVATEGALPGARLFFDHVRPDPSCD